MDISDYSFAMETVAWFAGDPGLWHTSVRKKFDDSETTISARFKLRDGSYVTMEKPFMSLGGDISSSAMRYNIRQV